MASDLQRYVSDNSLTYFGSSDRTTIDFVIASASSSKTTDSLFSKLSSMGLPNTAAAHDFVNELYSRVPRKRKHKHSAEDAARRQAEKDAKALRSQKFGFLLDDEAQNDVVEVRKSSKAKEKGKEREKDPISGRKDRHMRKRGL
ncbi:hypothetical protein NP233_g7209 [Leucocoprinus birnbaumii]|uniref:Uncharacterized protein n=1 Tax=Leucocoprinus birnbaumii TaxID=56174 RepID=A0AAD5VPP8_9AGAR|nr:hypothetical protein NP233_g7209 [Leucocoprinus birnbaumii]